MAEMRPLVFAVIAAMVWTGCFSYTGTRTPNLIASMPMPTDETAPNIDIDFRHEILANGKPLGEPPTKVSKQEARQAFDRVRAETPFLRNANFDLPDADLHLSIESKYESHEATWPVVLHVYTFTIFPYLSTTDVSLTATLSRADGGTLETYGATCEIKTVYSFLIAPAILEAFAYALYTPNVIDATYRDLFIQIAEDLPKYARKPPSPPT